MKYPTLQKVTLLTVALVASLALAAQAGPKTLSTAKQKHGSGNKSGHLWSAAGTSGNVNRPASTYVVDDGTAEDSVGLTLGGDIISLNEFAVIPGAETINSVSIAWGTPAFADPSLNGLPYTIAIWSDPNGDGNPNDAVLLTTASGVVASAGTDTFITTTISPTTITTANFFVGFVITHSGGQFPSAFDESPPVFSNRSYVAGGASGNINDLNSNDLPVAAIESFGLVGNWLIQATSGDQGTPTPTPTPTPPANARWYNGDFNDVNGLANERDTSLGEGAYASTYDDFNVPEEAGWDVTSVFSNNLSSTNVTAATWEIRQGISEGNGGTLVASGMTVAPTVTATGRSGFGFTEYTVEVGGLSVHLPQGDYFLNVTPTGDLSGRAFVSTTSGGACVGTPCGNNLNAFFDSPFFGFVFSDTANLGQPYDFSMGVNGDVSGSGGGITLSAVARGQGGKRRVALSWSPADGGNIDILRDGAVIHTTADDGRGQDHLGSGPKEVHTYQVCETGTSNCSNEVKVKIPGNGGH